MLTKNMKYFTCCLGEHKRLLMLNFRTTVYTFWTCRHPKITYTIHAHTNVQYTKYLVNCLQYSYYSQSPTMALLKRLLDHCLPPNKTVCGSENALNRSHTKNLTCHEASMEQVAIFFSSKGPLLSSSFRPKPVALCVQQTDQNFFSGKESAQEVQSPAITITSVHAYLPHATRRESSFH